MQRPTIVLKVALISLALFVGSGAVAWALSVDDTQKYAWGENIGWLNWGTPEGDVFVPDGSGELTGYVWGENVGWISLNCSNTSSCGSVDYGVSNSGGDVSGYAWGENIGWISFSCTNTASCGVVDYGVTFDNGSRDFTGYAWGENAGWISMNCDNTGTCGTVDYKVSGDDGASGGGGGGGFLPSPTPTPTSTPIPRPLRQVHLRRRPLRVPRSGFSVTFLISWTVWPKPSLASREKRVRGRWAARRAD
jgi:hypothetical protein